jgi:hypothetical protein
VSFATLYAFKMAATFYAFKIKSVLFETVFLHLEFKTHLSIQISNFLAAEKPTVGKVSPDLTLGEAYAFGAQLAANTPKIYRPCGGVVVPSFDAHRLSE